MEFLLLTWAQKEGFLELSATRTCWQKNINKNGSKMWQTKHKPFEIRDFLRFSMVNYFCINCDNRTFIFFENKYKE